MVPPGRFYDEGAKGGRLVLAFGLGQADGALSFFPLATLPEEFDALESFQDGPLSGCGAGCFEAVVL